MTLLGAAGLIPFIGAAAGLWLPSGVLPTIIENGLGDFLLIYAAVIIAYLTGLNAGAKLQNASHSTGQFASGQALLLVAFFLALPMSAAFSTPLPDWARFFLMSVVFAIVLVMDLSLARRSQIPQWFRRLRIFLTSCVGACLLLAAVKTGI